MSNLIDYLNTVDKNATARDACIQNPELAIKMFGLSSDEQFAVMSRDKKRLAELVGIHEDSLSAIQVTNGMF